MVKIISSTESEMEVENVADGILMSIADDQGIGFTARITLSEDQALHLKEGIDELLKERWETMQQEVSAESALPDKPEELEVKLRGLVEEYVWTIALLEEWDKREPRISPQPASMTIAEWYRFSQQRDEQQIKLKAWREMSGLFVARLHELTKQIGEAMPDAVKLIVPVFSGWYTVWGSIAGRKKYNLRIEAQRDDKEPHTFKRLTFVTPVEMP